ncbi:uncharacterized protein MAM_07965 [Metarhizium album ARSEF 1941]|uniref:Uncharacterized protein n=1 Tax=Metarhizium album (strain ARSEF 1941) TaxID=1081103 RepID=A0A0B2WJW9_METAS|nr:uncharacterized protein MAM_07965 [Metarhizium album ARSEF 1941]KHN94228.1 hypothetical protein MAM_07965 [Metarhizium album ARSEF 1941]
MSSVVGWHGQHIGIGSPQMNTSTGLVCAGPTSAISHQSASASIVTKHKGQAKGALSGQPSNFVLTHGWLEYSDPTGW